MILMRLATITSVRWPNFFRIACSLALLSSFLNGDTAAEAPPPPLENKDADDFARLAKIFVLPGGSQLKGVRDRV